MFFMLSSASHSFRSVYLHQNDTEEKWPAEQAIQDVW
jgi:hypothetical protein